MAKKCLHSGHAGEFFKRCYRRGVNRLTTALEAGAGGGGGGGGAWIAQWLERRIRDRKVAGSSPGRSGGRILLQGQLSVLTVISVSVPPRVTAVARKRSLSFCQKCRWQVTAKHTCTLRM